MRFRQLYRAVKPGIIYGNLLHFVAGGLLAYRYDWSWTAFAGGAIGTALVIASACLINNYFDRDIDAAMPRTRERPTVRGVVSVRMTIIAAAILLVLGFGSLLLWTNTLTVWLGVIAYVSYAFVYTYAKRKTVHSTLIGTLPGALPALAGYTSLAGVLDAPGLWLFGLILVWQMPHFYAIALFRRSEYAAAKVPIVSLKYPVQTVRIFIIAWIGLYVAVTLALCYVAIDWRVAALLVGGAVWWLMVSLRQYYDKWARQVFGASLILSLLTLVAMGLNLALVHLL